MMPTCTECGQECEPGTSFVAVLEREGRFSFRFGCEHHPVGDAVAYLGSKVCAAMWVKKQCRGQRNQLMEAFVEFSTRSHPSC